MISFSERANVLMRTSEKVFFENSRGIRLCGIIDRPPSGPSIAGIFTHCFTCTKDLKAIVRISRKLAESRFAILRFDFTGLGESDGDFSESNFRTACDDLLAAAAFLEQRLGSPKLLIGHSFGGGVITAMAASIPSAAGLVTIAAPSSTEHLADNLSRQNPAIVSQGEGSVEIGGRSYLLKKQLIDDLRNQDLPGQLRELKLPHLILHPREDETLPFWHAERMFEWSGGIKSLVTLDGSDHLLITRGDDCRFVADLIALWFRRVWPGAPALR
jgi:putative redox protein